MHRFVHCATLGGGQLSVTYTKKNCTRRVNHTFVYILNALFSSSIQYLIAASEAPLSS